MSRLVGIGLLAALALTPPCAMAQVPAKAVAAIPKVKPTAESRAQALKLAETLNSEELTRRQIQRLYATTVPAMIEKKPEFKELEGLYPGVTNVALQAEREIVEAAAIKELPGLHLKIAAIYADYLSPADLSVIETFYTGPTGRKVFDAIIEGRDFSKLISRNLDGQSSDVTAADLRSTVGGSIAKLSEQMDAGDRKRMVAFSFSPAGRKWAAIQPMIVGETANSANSYREAVMQRAAEHVLEKVGEYIQKKSADEPNV